MLTLESLIWDWNGTLLNDVDIAVAIINQLLADRALKHITVSHYLEVFTFPVQDYYELIGFDLKKEPFEIPALQFITCYHKAIEACPLQPNASSVLRRLQKVGLRQFILSAMEQQQLEKTLSDSGIAPFFEGIYGLDNHFATSKLENGIAMIKDNNLDPGRILMIGDTVHDYEVSCSIGCTCVLIAHGHQSKERLLKTGAVVLDNLEELDFFVKLRIQ